MAKSNVSKGNELLEAGKRYALVADKAGTVVGIINTPRNGPSDVPVTLMDGTSAYKFDGPTAVGGRKAVELQGFSAEDLDTIKGKLAGADAEVIEPKVVDAPVVAKADAKA